VSDLIQLYADAAGRLAVQIRFRVRYHETDAMGIVHHTAYIAWFEEGRSAFTRAIGYPYARMEADGVSLAVAEVAARYHLPARYDEEVLVATTLTQLRSRGIHFAYEVRRAADGALLVTGSTQHISVDSHSRVLRLSDEAAARIQQGMADRLAALTG
jgi:acyl-CoA thioester hydrolase